MHDPVLEFVRQLDPAWRMLLTLCVWGAWILAVWTIFTRSKFRTKWLWIALSLLTWDYIPFGTIYVLLFAWLGPRSKRVEKPKLDLGAI